MVMRQTAPAHTVSVQRSAQRQQTAQEQAAQDQSAQGQPMQGAAQASARAASEGGPHGELFAPVREALAQVENKLRMTDSALFAPLSDAFVTLIGSGGKRLRPALALLAWGAGTLEESSETVTLAPNDAIIALAASVEMLHTSTLVHDDVIDGALLRRGAPTLNASWSGGSTVMAGNYMFGSAARFAAETGSMRVIHLFADTLRVIVDGELHQLLDRYDYGQEMDRYLSRIYAKTASLLCAATEGGAALAGLDEARIGALRAYGYNLGMAFQIVDDILDFTGDANTLGKPAGSDLNQGTLTLPFFAFLQKHPEREALIARLEETRNRADAGEIQAWRDLVQEVVWMLRATDAAEVARAEAARYLELARAELTGLPDNVCTRTLHALCDFVLQRTY